MMEKSTSKSEDRMKESVESWEVLSVPSASGQEDESIITVSQLAPSKPRKNGSLERLLIEAQRESLQSSARQSRFQSKQSSPVFPDSPAESGDYYLGYDEFARQMLSPSAADGSTDWFWDWNYNSLTTNNYRSGNSRPSPRKQFSAKRKFFGLIVLTNVLALMLGAGLGYYLSKKILVNNEPDLSDWYIYPSGGVFSYS